MNTPAAEISVVGGILAFSSETKDALRLLTAEMFTNDWMSQVFAVCVELDKSGVKIDITTVESRLGKEHRVALVGCVKRMPSLSGFKDYCAAVLEAWRVRTVCAELQGLVCEYPPAKQLLEGLDRIVAKQRAIEQGLNDNTAVDFWGGVTRYLDMLFSPSTAVRTGWSAFDRCTGGLQRKGFYVISGRSGMGKTDFALALATNLSAHYRVSYLSMEMPVEQLMERVTSRMARVEGNRLRDRTVTPEDMQRVADALTLMKNKTNLTIDEKQRISVTELESKILRQTPDVLFVDHIGLMNHDSTKKTLWEAVADTSQRLKELAMKHNIVLVALVQEGRGGATGKANTANLKGSDNLSNDADGIFQMQMQETEAFISGDAWLDSEVCVTKNRHGGTGKLLYHWQPQYHDWRAIDRER